jgi:ribonuclease E
VQAESGEAQEAGLPAAPVEAADLLAEAPAEAGETAPASDDDPRNRRRGRRGGRRRRPQGDGELSPFAAPGADQPELPPVYAGPTPADPFGGRAFDIFDVMDQAERAAEARPAPRVAVAAEIANNTAPEPDAPNAEPVMAGETAAEPVVEPEPEPAPPRAEPPAEARADIVNSSAPEPAGEALQAAAEPVGETLPVAGEPADEALQAAGEPEASPVPANDTAPEPAPEAAPEPATEPALAEPAIKPILVGAGGEPPAEPKRGWWRR